MQDEGSSSVKHASPHTTRKVLALAFAAAVVLFGVFAASAAASPENGSICSDCHTGAGTAPMVTVTSGAGVDPVTYSVHQTSNAWAAFDLSNNLKRIAGDTGSDSTFTAPLGHYIRVCVSNGFTTGTFTQAYLLTPAAPRHGSISPSVPQVAAPGASQAFTFTADPGYHLTEVKVNGVSNAAAVTAGSYTFTNVQADSTLVATFVSDVSNFTITPTAGANGTISPASAQTVASGASVTFTATPNAGFKVDTAKVDGVAVTLAAGNKYTFSNVTADHAFNVTFKTAAPAKCTVTISLTGIKSGVLKLHKSVVIKGAVKPARSGRATVTIQRKSGSKWVSAKTVGAAVNATSGAYSCSYKPTTAGTYRAKTSVAKTAAWAAATTAYKTFKVK
jgi:hypothetical protein